MQATVTNVATNMANTSNTPDAQALLHVLDLERVAEDAYVGISPSGDRERVYGGQALAQALIAASRTLESWPQAPLSRLPHSLHGYFLRSGNTRHPILYRVERMRDGRSFSTRRVVAEQDERPIFVCTLSFHKPETGLEHQSSPPEAAPPEGLRNFHELGREQGEQDGSPEELPGEHPIRSVDMRPVAGRDYLLNAPGASPLLWMCVTAPLPDDPVIHRALIAYMSDATLLSEALRPHHLPWHHPGMQVASLDHALWFHREARADEWLLCVPESPSAAAARGFCRGGIYTRNGSLAASVAQEGLMRGLMPDTGGTG